jgi:subtilase family serine protease
MSRDFSMERMVLVLQPDSPQDAALEELLRAQQDPESSVYHHWLTPVEFGKRFGVSMNDLKQVTNWLRSYGMRVEEIPAARRSIVFSGTAAQVESLLHTRMQRYVVGGELHYANANDPEIPSALAPVVRGIVSLHDFRSKPLHVVAPEYTVANGTHYLQPQDWATIYDVLPLYNQGLDGTGQSIAVLGRVDIALSDIRTFRTNAGLPANDPQVILNGPDPGFPWCDDELESAMDVEWAGALAKNASVKFVTSQSAATDGINLSAQYAVNHNLAPIISLSYGLCESSLGTAGNAFWNSTWAQAAAQGMTVFVSSGDNGAAGCDSPSQTTASRGKAVNGLCSSPYSTCVGGTQFNDTFNPGQYWSSSNGAGQSSALGYIPESAWNESSWSGGLWAGSGGMSTVYAKPAWQAGVGVPADGKRDVPDISAHASIQDAYVVQVQGGLFYASGTSAAAPSLASVMALVNEQAGAAQGNANPLLYALANQQMSAGGAAVFHDMTSGNNGVPGVTGFTAGTGYDEATGLGSVDASLLVNHWSGASQSTFTLSPNVSSLMIAPGGSGTATITMVVQGGFSSTAALSVSGAPAGVTVRLSSASISSSRSVMLTFSAASSAAAKSSTITITGTGGGLTRSTTLTLVVAVPSFSFTSSGASVTVRAGTLSKLTVTTAAMNGFKSAITLSVSGLPRGVTGTFSPASIASPGNGSSTLTLSATSAASSGMATLTLKGIGGGVTQSQTISVTIVVPTVTLAASASSVTVTRGNSVAITLNSSAISGFASAVTLSASGLPPGVTALFAPSTISAPGNGSSTLTLKAASTARVGASTVVITAAGGGVAKTQTIGLRVQ